MTTSAPRDEGFEEFKLAVRELADRTHPLPKAVVDALRKPRARG
jgi:hypothetical protein